MDINKKIPLTDSNVIISFFAEDKHFDQSREIISEGVYVNDFILCETLNFFQNKFSFYISHKIEKLILTNTENFCHLPSHLNFYLKAMEIREKFAYNQLTFTDSFILSQAEFHGLKVCTRDQKMKNYEKVGFVI